MFCGVRSAMCSPLFAAIESLNQDGGKRCSMNGDVCSEQAIAAIDNLAIDQPRFGHELMLLDRPGSVDVEDFMSVSHQPVGNQHAVATEINTLRTHVGRA